MRSIPALSRRKTLRALSYGLVCSGLCGSSPFRWLVSDIQAGDSAIFKMSFDEFPQLSKSYGSVRVNVAGIPNASNQIVVTRMPGNKFYAVSSKCTHSGVAVNPFKKGKGLYCAAHGSQFDVDGRVVRGPAISALKLYSSKYDGKGTVSVEFPELGYSVNASMLQSIEGDRLHLTFETIPGMTYSVAFSSQFGNEYVRSEKFAVTKEGPYNIDRLTADRGVVNIYLKPLGKAGFIKIIRE